MTGKRDRYLERINKLNTQIAKLQLNTELLEAILKARSLSGSSLNALRIAYFKHEGMLSNKYLTNENYTTSSASYAIRELKDLGLISPYIEDYKFYVLKGWLPFVLKVQQEKLENPEAYIVSQPKAEIKTTKTKKADLEAKQAEEEEWNRSKQAAILADRERRQKDLEALINKQNG